MGYINDYTSYFASLSSVHAAAFWLGRRRVAEDSWLRLTEPTEPQNQQKHWNQLDETEPPNFWNQLVQPDPQYQANLRGLTG